MKKLLIPVFLFAAAARAVDLPSEGDRWSRLGVENITIYSNAGDRVARGTAEGLIRFRETLSQVMKIGMRSPLPTYVYVFKSEASFRPYREAVAGPKSEVVGLFSQHNGANWMLIQARSDLALDRVVYHELTHYLIRNNLAGAPPWLDEGLASFYETFAPMGKSDSVTIGKPPYKYHDALLQSGLIPLRKLLAYRRPREHKRTPELEQFYLQSWFFVHYLLIGNPARGAGLGSYLGLVAEGQPMEKAFEAAFGAKMEQVDAELAGYLHRERFNMIQYSVPPSKVTFGAAAEMPRDQTLYALGKLLARVDPSAGAEAFLAESVKLNPNNAAAVADLALVKDVLGKGVEAEALYKRAVKIGGSGAEPYVQAALHYVVALQHRARDGEEPSKEEIEQARALAEEALTFAPNDALANAIVGASYTFPGESAAKGIAASSHAFELSPAMIDVAADLVLLYQRSGKTQLAKAMMDRFIVPAGDEEWIAYATENFAIGDYQRALELKRAHQDAEAAKLLKRAAETTKNERLKGRIAAAEKGGQA